MLIVENIVKFLLQPWSIQKATALLETAVNEMDTMLVANKMLAKLLLTCFTLRQFSYEITYISYCKGIASQSLYVGIEYILKIIKAILTHF